MTRNIVPPEDHPSPATYRLTREFLALVAPGFDPDAAPDRELYAALGDADRWLEFLDNHPDRRLVRKFWRENHRDVDDMFFKATGRHPDEQDRN